MYQQFVAIEVDTLQRDEAVLSLEVIFLFVDAICGWITLALLTQ